jgi:starch synthase
MPDHQADDRTAEVAVTIRVLSAASEAVPLIKTGGLADVVGALPAALAPHDVKMTVLLPGYPAVMRAIGKGRLLHAYPSLMGEPARLVSAKLGDHPLVVLDAPAFFARDGSPYGDAGGKDWPDNWRRFAAFGRAAADLAGGAVKGKRFDLLHAHDWQAAMAPAYLRFAAPEGASPPPSVMTIHNMAFQGWFEPGIFAALGLPRTSWSIEGVEYNGGVGFLKAGLQAASAITTVSPTYAAEIRDPEFGMGLEGLIRSRGADVHGILNGIETEQWSPAADALLAARFDVRKLDRRARNKRALEAEFGLEPGDGPLFIVVSRLTWQKGMDVLVAALDHLVGIGGRLALLGSGDVGMERAFQQAAARHPGRIGVRIGYDEALSHRLQAGGDAILIPSRFEPCGLTQLYGLAYGCVPIVARTGGLADTVIDANVAALQAGVATGIQFDGVTLPAVTAAISRAAELHADRETWAAMQRCGMRGDFSWETSGKAYAELYRSLLR